MQWQCDNDFFNSLQVISHVQALAHIPYLAVVSYLVCQQSQEIAQVLLPLIIAWPQECIQLDAMGLTIFQLYQEIFHALVMCSLVAHTRILLAFSFVFCEGRDSVILSGSGLIYTVTANNLNNCTSLIDNTSMAIANDFLSIPTIKSKQSKIIKD